MRKYLVTGGSGFIGSHLVQSLLEANNCQVDILDVRRPSDELPKFGEWIAKDIREDLTGVIKNYDAVYHLAAIANARTCGQYPQRAYEINVMGTLNVANACRENEIPRMLYASSTWMAGLQVGQTIHEYDPFEIHQMNTVYGATKLAGEMILYAMKAENKAPNFTIMRYGIPYGERMWEGLVVRAFMLQAEKYKVISIFGDGLQGRNFLYVKDMCEGQIKCLSKKAAGQVYHLGSEEFVTVKELAEEVVKYYPAKITYITQARVEPKIKNVSSKKAEKELGWKPKTSFSRGIKRCIDWWKTVRFDQKEDVPYFVP